MRPAQRVSGSYTYRLYGLDAACVLKVTMAGSPPYIRQRAPREIVFYAYHAQLTTFTCAGLPLETVRRHMQAYGLRTRLVLWPAYL
jgi:hypothetical protein